MPLKNVKLLLVEPDNDLRYVLPALLETFGCTVATAKNGTEALAIVNTLQPTAVFTEIHLEDVPGLELARLLKRECQNKNVALVALTGHWSPGIEQEALQAGFTHYLCKPVSVERMVKILNPAADLPAYGLTHMTWPH